MAEVALHLDGRGMAGGWHAARLKKYDLSVLAVEGHRIMMSKTRGLPKKKLNKQ